MLYLCNRNTSYCIILVQTYFRDWFHLYNALQANRQDVHVLNVIIVTDYK